MTNWFILTFPDFSEGLLDLEKKFLLYEYPKPDIFHKKLNENIRNYGFYAKLRFYAIF